MSIIFFQCYISKAWGDDNTRKHSISQVGMKWHLKRLTLLEASQPALQNQQKWSKKDNYKKWYHLKKKIKITNNCYKRKNKQASEKIWKF